MDFEKYQIENKLVEKLEVDKVLYIAFYILTVENKNEFSVNDIVKYLEKYNYNIPNLSRLKTKLKKDVRFGIKNEKYYLTAKTIAKYKNLIIFDDFETILSDNEFLDESLFPNQHKYLLKLVKQVNASYRNNLFDAAAVLIRRIFEILLIKSYENFNIEDEIKKDGNYLMLEKIIDNAVSNKTLKLSRSRAELDKIRNVGNFAAHKIEYNTNKNDLDKIKDSYRAITEELLYKSGLNSNI